MASHGGLHSDHGTKMTDEEQMALMTKLDRDLEEFTQQQVEKSKERHEECKKQGIQDQEIDIDALAEELKQHPAFMTEFDPSKPMSAATEALVSMMYESDSPDSNAENYKEDGNKNFKLKKYRWAIDNYTAGIKCKPVNKELNAILYTNRAASHFHIGNFRSSLNDCILARKFKPDHMKAINRGILCCMELKKYEDAMKWCDSGLLISSEDSKLLDMRSKADKLNRKAEKDLRKALANERKKEIEEQKLLKVIQERKVQLDGVQAGSPLLLSSLESHHPSQAKVYLDEEGLLLWPVLFMYPEYGETDFITAFKETDMFEQHLMEMFGNALEPPGWDVDRKYTPKNIMIYFEEKKKQKLHEVKTTSSLKSALSDERFVIQGGTPAFILLIKDSEFAKSFYSKYLQDTCKTNK